MKNKNTKSNWNTAKDLTEHYADKCEECNKWRLKVLAYRNIIARLKNKTGRVDILGILNEADSIEGTK